METLEQLKDIVKNSPEGAQAVMMVCNPIYTKLENDFWYAACGGQDWVQVVDKQIGIMRSLSDIKKIIELMEDKKKAYQAYVALEEIKQKYNGENKIAKELLKSAYECDEFSLPSDLRKDIKGFLGGL